MQRIMRCALVVALAALPLAAQQSLPEIAQAQQVLVLADSAGAQSYAKSLYDEAALKIRYAQDNLNSRNSAIQQQARMNAQEALFAARAALAKARWLSTNTAVSNLQSDIRHFGGTSNVNLPSEDPNIMFQRGTTTRERMAAAQMAIDQARAAGAEQAVADNDLATAIGDLDSAKKVSRNGAQNSDTADYLAYVSEMIARRAYYMARFNESSRSVPDLQLQRTRLAQTYSEQQATSERTQREEAERRAADLQQQLNAQAANSQAQTAELENLRQQIEASRTAMLQRVETDRQARLDAEKNLDAAMRAYESAATNGNQADLDRLRRQVEDQEIALRAIQERERLDAQAIGADVTSLRNSPNSSSDLIAQRQAELDAYQRELTSDLAARTEIQTHHEAAVLAANQQRQQSETAAYRAEIESARQAAELAQQRAVQTQEQLTEAQRQAQQQLASQQQRAQQTEQQLTQQVQQKQSEAEQARQAAQAAQAELARTRDELAQKDAEARQLRMQQELSKIASTRQEPRGLVVTLPSGIFFDTGKSALKPGAKRTLDRIATQLQTDSSIKVFVEGHTDSTGSVSKNLTLSEKRADSVRDYLISKGVSQSQISAAGKGEAEPVATNKTVAGRQQNRRVELVITRSGMASNSPQQ
jgi:outer membrane protein OmpA-like peptidoglycan-associated protein